MSIHLFLNIVTAFVNAQFVTISEFFNAGKIEQFRLPLQPLFGCRLELIVGRKSLSTEVFFSNLETDGNHLVPGQENMVDDAFLQIRIQVLQLVQHATGEQVHCRAKAGVHGSTFLGASL